MIYIVGSVLALAAWAVQVFKTLIKKDFELSPIMLVLYGAACVLFTMGDFLGNDIIPGILNIICIVLVIMILVGLLTTKRIARK